MNTKTTIIYFILAVATLHATQKTASGQNMPAAYFISGRVVDSTTQQPLVNITVTILKEGSVPVKAVLTNAEGSFSVAGLTPLRYSVGLVAAAYVPKIITVDLTDTSSKGRQLGAISMSSRGTVLKEIVVTAGKPLIKQEIDRIVYDLQADPDSKGSSLLEMMRKVPYLSLDAENNILLKGSSGYRIFINGKPSSLMERNPVEVLRSMPASTIQRLEVITTPSAKYDAEGLASIINIITHKKIGNGYRGAVNLNHKHPVGGPGMGGSLTLKQGKFGISAFGGASQYNVPRATTAMKRVSEETDAAELQQEGTSASDSRSGYFGTELSYEIDSLNLISAQFNLNGSRSESNGSQRTALTDAGIILQEYTLAHSNEGVGKGLDAALNYQLGFKADKNRLLTFSYRYITFGNDQHGDMGLSNRKNYETPDYRQANEQGTDEHTFQVDYVRPIKKLIVEAGLKGILRSNFSDFQYHSFNAASGKFEFDPTRSNQFNNDQHVYGLYNTYQYRLKNWGVIAGARIEKTVIRADFISTASKVSQNYFHIIPSLALNRKLKNGNTINFGFTQRIKRPGIYKLNPFVDRSNPNAETSGNPELRPVLVNDMLLGFTTSKKMTVNVGLGYAFAKNLDLRITRFDPVTNITRTTYENTGKVRAIISNFNLNYPLSKNWNISVNGNLNYMQMEGAVNSVLIKKTWLVNSIAASTGYRFNNGWRLNATLNSSGRNIISLQAVSNAIVSTSFSVNKDILKDKLSFSATLTNPFTKYRYNRVEISDIRFTETSSSQVYFRSFSISVNYNFGKLKEAIKKNKRGINNDDMSNK